jgi:hypothetical protein
MAPHARIALRLLLRGTVLWVLVRGLLFAFGGCCGGGVGPGGAALLVIPVAVGIASDVELRRSGEALFLANLGVGRALPQLLTTLVAAAGELALSLLPPAC